METAKFNLIDVNDKKSIKKQLEVIMSYITDKYDISHIVTSPEIALILERNKIIDGIISDETDFDRTREFTHIIHNDNPELIIDVYSDRFMPPTSAYFKDIDDNILYHLQVKLTYDKYDLYYSQKHGCFYYNIGYKNKYFRSSKLILNNATEDKCREFILSAYANFPLLKKGKESVIDNGITYIKKQHYPSLTSC